MFVKKQCTFYFEPRGGLGNRMRTIAAAYSLAQKYDYRLVVLWKKDQGLNCAYKDLFYSTTAYTVIDRISKIGILFYRIYTICKNGFVEKNGTSKRISKYEDAMKNRKTVYIKSFNQFFRPSTFQLFPVKEIITQKADCFLGKYADNVVGVHVRRTDNMLSVNTSKTEYFIKTMEKMLSDDKDVVFLLCSDDPSVKKEMQGHFGDRVIIRTEEGSKRNSAEGIIEALTDMYCLSRCKLILGSNGSSFSDVAAKLGSVEHRIIIEEE